MCLIYDVGRASHFITTLICIKMAAHQLSAELDGFLMEAEGCLVDIERSSCDGNDVAAMDGVLQQAEWLFLVLL